LFNEGPLRECTNTLLRNPDKIRDWLNLADKHMQTYAENPDIFLLPKAHEFLKPLIESYALNLEGFTQYLLGLRDCFDRGSTQFKEVQEVFRRTNGRYVQQSRRERIGRAVTKATELFGDIPYTKRMQWMAELEHSWAQRRLAFLEQQRQRIGDERLNTEQRTEYLLEFWDIIDTEIYEGNLPPWN
jgi:hypothetical protein